MLKKIIDAAAPLIKQRRHISPIWFLPFLALVIGVWLVWRTLLDTGPQITVEFESSAGIVAQQTQLRYKGITFGVVKEITPKPDLSGVIVTIEIDKSTLQKRRDKGFPADTKIWLVEPQVSLTGISGLSALVSGNYITAQLGENERELTTHFIAVKNPPLDFKEPGLHLTLDAKTLGALSEGSPIYYRKLNVGEVKGYHLNNKTQHVDINILIFPEYQHLIKDSTRFWNVSGFSVNAGLTGVTVQTESVATILAGGIVFDTPDIESAQSVENGYQFQLFDSEASAGATINATMRFPNADYLTAGQTEIRYQGLTIGIVNKIIPRPDGQGVIADVSFKPEAESLLREDTQFWLVRPEISAAKVTGLSALSGNYISLYAGSGKSSREFTASLSVPPLPSSAPGLHLVLQSDDSGGLNVGAPILYKKLDVGSVQNIRFAPDKSKVLIDIYINPAYASLVNHATRFWNAGGVEINGSLSNIKIRTGSLASVLQGGIIFDQFSENVKTHAAQNGDVFTLYSARSDAANAGISVELHLQTATGLMVGSEIRHLGLKVGEITKLVLNKNLDGVTAFASMNINMKPLLTSGTVFWRVEPHFGLTKTSHLDTLIGGSYLDVRAGKGSPTNTFTVTDAEPIEKARAAGLNLVLTSKEVGSLKTGNPVLYRQIPIGTVLGTDLSDNAENVRIYINIDPTYAHLVQKNSRFVNVSGVLINAGLFSGVHIDTESLESIIAGGITLEISDKESEPAADGTYFELHEK